jgi:hypothetical protein
MRHLSILLLSSFLIVLPSCKYFKGKGLFGRKNDNSAVIMKAREDSTRIANSKESLQSQVLSDKKSKIDSVNTSDKKQFVIESGSNYNIIVGSFKTPEYAKVCAEVYSKQGYNPKVIRMDGSNYDLVSIESFENFGKAFSRLKYFKDTVNIESWIYVKK